MDLFRGYLWVAFVEELTIGAYEGSGRGDTREAALADLCAKIGHVAYDAALADDNITVLLKQALRSARVS